MFLLKSGPIFDMVAKLGKATRNNYDWGAWLILKDLLKNWAAKGVASEANDFNSKVLFGSVTAISALNAERKKKS